MKNRILQFRMMAKVVMIGLLMGIVGKTYAAYDFSAVCETGQTLYYKITDSENHYVNLTYPGRITDEHDPWDYYTQPSGDIIIPETVQNNNVAYTVIGIGADAFYCCRSISSVVIPSTVTTIGAEAFWSCSGLMGDLVIPNSVTYIGGYAFYCCNGLTGNLILPNSLTYIGQYAFSGCNHLTGSLFIPNAVTTIGGYAFNGCSFNEVHYNATNCADFSTNYPPKFNGCGGVLFIGDNVEKIPAYIFIGCSSFTGSLTIPNSVTSIGDNAFAGCSGFTGDLTIGNSVTTIGNYAFSSCNGFTNSLVISNSVITIGEGAFYNCSSFTDSLIIGNSVSSIGGQAFFGCSGLTGGIVIPNSVNLISYYAFYGCNGLTDAVILGTTPPSLGGSAFDNSSFPIYVPYESLNDYKTTTNWSSYESRIYPMSYKTILGYNKGNNNWQFIASPLAENTAPTTVDNMITETTYDLYRFNQSATLEWENYKQEGDHYHFNLTNGQGYLYANAEEVNLIFKGVFNEDEIKEVDLVYDAAKPLAGWNLVGNPFPVNAYANRSYYVMNEEGTAIEPVAVSMETAIPACTGVMVKADNAGETVTFSKTMPEMVPNQGNIQIAVMQTNKSGVSMMDKAIVSFNAGDRLEKFVFNEDNAQLYIPNGKTNYAIACAKKTGEMPLNFKAHKNDIYTLTVDTEKTEMEYLHLIDNLTGNDVDLLAEPNYTFEARPTDYASRFKLVFSANEEDGASTGSETFAFVNNGNIIITTDAFDASLQVIDMLGRVLVCRDALRASAISTTGMPPGVYVLRLISGDDVRTQKIVVR